MTRLRLYSDADLALIEAMETDPVVMSELGGPVPREEIPALRLLYAPAELPHFTAAFEREDVRSP